MRNLKTIDITLVGMFVALMAIGANLTSFIVIGGVPITLQTFFAILAGLILGSRVGSISMITYALVGLVGVPVFAKFGAGLSTLLSPSFGFILSFILVAYVVGKMVEKNRSFTTFVIAALVGFVINYIIGTNWMYFGYKFWAAAPEGFSYKMAWLWMVVPLPKDVILAVFAGILGYRLEKTVLSKGQFKHLKRAA